MQWRNSPTRFGFIAKFFHWASAAAFLAAYPVVYYVICFMDDSKPESWPVLNIHWVLGLLVGILVLPRLLWRLFDAQPQAVPGSALEHSLAQAAHWGLYGLLILQPLTGYLGTGAATNFGLSSITGFNESALFTWISQHYGLSWEAFEAPLDWVHHFIGKWVAWVVVGLHVAAAVFHHRVRHDDVLKRMLPSLPGRK